ncbi:zonadhesin-like [Diorhabda sublineata]|uniref:zonadhesin-like n=1 Tax=Diorhabda sublineata TaxID=1163346 RepID=UPI0024E04155|nr:zonadhesin-like [Diorhabda sublineata]
MNNSFLLFFVLFFTTKTINAGLIDCPPNSELRSLGGSNCYTPVPTCQDPNPSNVTNPEGICFTDLVSGCWCNDGYLMNDNTCVLKENCP